MGFVDDFEKLERVERQAPPPHPSPLKGEGVGGGVGLAAAGRRATQAEWVKQNLPLCSEFAAACRDAFGVGVRMTYAEEAGHIIGKPLPDPVFSVSGDALLPLQKETKA